MHATPQLLVASDGSPGAATAVRVAAGLFGGARASIVTVSSVPAVRGAMPTLPTFSPAVVHQAIDDLTAAAQRDADETAEWAAEQARALGLDATPLSMSGSGAAWEGLLEAARQTGADVLVCGTRGRGAFARTVLGSTASRLLHTADLPLLVVPDGGGAIDGPVVAAYDGSEGADAAIAAVGRLLPDRPLAVLYAWEPAFHRTLAAHALAAGGPVDGLHHVVADLHDAFALSATETTEAGVAAARAAGMAAVGETVEANDGAWRTVAAAAQARGASLIAVGTRGRGAARSALLGSVSSGLVHNAELPVLVVPRGS